MAMLQFQQISKSYPATPILANASFQVNGGERIGLVGPNGAGKSTILQLIVGELMPDSGQVITAKQTLIAHVRQHTQPAGEDQSLLDYVLHAVPVISEIEDQIGEIEHQLQAAPEANQAPLLRRLGELQTQFETLGGYQLHSDAEAVLTGLGFRPDELGRPFREYSGGWRMRAELSRSLIARADLLLLDEPTNYLDVPAIEWLRDYLAGTAATYILVSHDRYLLNELTSITLAIENHTVERYPGNYNYYVRVRAERHAQLAAAKKNQDRKIEQLERFTDRFRAKASKATQVKSREKELARIERIEVPTYSYRGVKLRLPTPSRCGQRVAQLQRAGKTYDGQHWVLRDLDLEIERGEKLAIVGPNGMGKTTLLRLLAGRLQPEAGSCELGHNVAVGYQAQDFPETLDANLTAWETVRRATADLTDGDIRGLLGSFGFSGKTIDKKVQVLSGGEKVRIALCRLLVTAPNFLLLDEPTTHLDIPTRELLQDALAAYQGTFCLVSHDVEFIRNTAEAVLEIAAGGVTKFVGNYDYYRQKKAADAAAAAEPPAAKRVPEPEVATATTTRAGSAEDRRASKREAAERRQRLARHRRPLEEKISSCEALMEALQSEQDELIGALSGGTLAAADIVAKQQRLKAITGEIQSAEIDWAWAVDELDTLLAEN